MGQRPRARDPERLVSGEFGGTAVARALFGQDNPGGKLPYTVYQSLDGVPPQNEYDVTKGFTYQYFKGVPLFAFGHGLSYTHFSYSKLSVTTPSTGAKGQAEVAFDVKNVGTVAGDEVAQLLYAPEPQRCAAADSDPARL